jgi:hypothetical protein
MRVVVNNLLLSVLEALVWVALAFVVQRSLALGRKSILAPQLIALREVLEQHWLAFSRILIGTGFVISLALVWCLRAFPNSADEYSYLFGAQTFLAGRLWNPLPPEPQFFAFLHTLELNGKWVTMYTPGWPLLLALAGYFRLPYWLVCPVIGLVFLLVMFVLGNRQGGHLGAVLTILIIAVSPFFVFNAASYFNMVPSATAALLFGWAALEFFDRPSPLNALLTGVCLGALGFIRIYDVTIFFLAFAIGLLSVGKRRHYTLAPIIALGGSPFVAALLAYDRAITGSAFLLPEIWGNPGTELGFLLIDRGMTFVTEFFLALWSIVEFGRWTSPIFLFGSLAALTLKIRKHQWIFLDLIFPINVVAYLLVEGIGGNRYGPRYYFIGYPFLVLTVVSILVPWLQDTTGMRRIAFVLTLIVGHVLTCVFAIVSYARVYRGVVDERMDIYDQVQTQHIHNAVVVIRTVGGRYMPMTPMDLTRNGISIGDQDVIYSLDIRDHMTELRHLFPSREFYIYDGKLGVAKGELKPIRSLSVPSQSKEDEPLETRVGTKLV